MRRRLNSTVLVTSRSFGVDDASLREDLEAAVKEVRYNPYGRALTLEELRRAVGDVDGIIAGSEKIDASVFAAAPRLRVIARYGVGVDNIDLAAAREHGVVVTNAPGANAEAVAELTIGFLFALSRSLSRIDRAVHAGPVAIAPGSRGWGQSCRAAGAGTDRPGGCTASLGLGLHRHGIRSLH